MSGHKTSPGTLKLVVAGIVEYGNKFLICQRKYPERLCGKWEFPGGKVERGETQEAALSRELVEELGIVTRIGSQFHVNEYRDAYSAIKLVTYLATYISGEIHLLEHSDARWITAGELAEYEFAPADLEVVAKLLLPDDVL